MGGELGFEGGVSWSGSRGRLGCGLVELRGARRGIGFVAGAVVVGLLLVVVGVASLPGERRTYVDAGDDCGGSEECLEEPSGVELEEPSLDELVPVGDFMIGFFTGGGPTKPLVEARRDCVFEATIQSVDEHDPRVARVLVHEHDGRKTKAVVRGGYGSSGGMDYVVRKTVKFFCSSKSERDEAVGLYEDCQQRVRSRALRESKDGCVRAAAASTGEGCVGFCFNAFVKSVDPDDWRNAHVEIIERDGTRSRAVVRRSGVRAESRAPARDGVPVRFACMDRVNGVNGVLGFEGCVQMAVIE